MILGIHAASIGGRLPLVANMVENLSVIIKAAAVIKPIAKCAPLPPRTFRPATIAPMMVSKKTVTQVAVRL